MLKIVSTVTAVLGFALCGATAWPQTTPAPAISNVQFVNEVGHANATEVRLARVCSHRHDSQKVADLGIKMREDHTRAQDNLRELAKRKGWTIPEDPNAEQKAAVDRLDKLSGSSFDQAYVEQMVKDHEKIVSLVESYVRTGDDADLKAYAKEILPTLKHHLEMSKDLARSIGS